MRKKKGFTLVEVMIVVAIIALLAAIAIPNLLRARHNANEAAAQGTLSTISAAEQSYRGVNALYATLDQLASASPPYIDSTVDGVKQGYNFTNVSPTTPTATQFTISAIPDEAGQSGTRAFCVTEDGVVRFSTSSTAVGGNAACKGWTATGN